MYQRETILQQAWEMLASLLGMSPRVQKRKEENLHKISMELRTAHLGQAH